VLQSAVCVLGLIVFGFVFVRVAVAPERGLATPSTLGAVGGALILAAVLYFGRLRSRRIFRAVACWNAKRKRVALFVAHGGMTVVACVVALAAYKPFRGGWDVDIVTNAAVAWAKGALTSDPPLPGSTDSGYFGTYPNNIPLLDFLHLVALVVGPGAFPIVTLLMGPVLASVTVALVFNIARRHGTMLQALVAWAATWLLVGVNPWIAVPYTDTLTLIFPVLLVYILERAFGSPSLRGRLGWLACFGLATGVGAQLKMTVIVVSIAAALVICVASLARRGTRAALGVCAVVLVASTVVATEASAVVSKAVLPSGMIQSQPWPTQYWVLTGLSEPYGQWNSSVVALMNATTSDAVRRQTADAAIDSRLQELGVGGYVNFVYKKITWVYSDATFYALGEGQMSPVAPFAYGNLVARVIQEFISPGSGVMNTIYSTALQSIWLVVLGYGLVTMFRRLRAPFDWYVCLLTVSLLGVTAYQIVGEARARYVLIFVPLFVLLACFGSSRSTRQIAEHQAAEKRQARTPESNILL